MNMSVGSCHQGASSGVWESGWDVVDACAQRQSPEGEGGPVAGEGSEAHEDCPVAPSRLAAWPPPVLLPLSYTAPGAAQGAGSKACSCRH